MKKFMWFILALIALFILIANIGPLILLGVSVFLLYLIFKQFIKSPSTAGKVFWVIVGLIVLSIAVSNIYAVLGLVAIYFLYFIYQKWQEDKSISFNKNTSTAK
ncbi:MULTISPECIES: flagellar basal body rod protein [Bacillaceae]|uniref:Flagellar basal body rod protein n=1 Tax=Evansella alkalicola TaxID=745819 RepID=A0ABS6JTL7_9BACI|nr:MULTISPECIES: flagellar basal body rod protein [Bacillaceae]MBU9721929.1 flagellar basal body rod protein [Bacillus alkalicola]